MTDQNWEEIGESQTSPRDNRKRAEVETTVPKTENIIFIGSEMSYDSFWLKMMFIGAARFESNAKSLLRPANKNTVLYVDEGYVYLEKLAIDHMKDKEGFEIKKIASFNDIKSHMNANRQEYKIQDVMIFSHGLPSSIALNYKGSTDIKINNSNVVSINKDAFISNGRIFSYACRTGNTSIRETLTEEQADPGNSLAQKMADHFNIEVHAYLVRTFYGNVLREKSQSATISAKLKTERESKEGQVITLSKEHEALPHKGLAENGVNVLGAGWGARKEGTNGYALWRKQGGRCLPTAADTPKGLATNMRVFKPRSSK